MHQTQSIFAKLGKPPVASQGLHLWIRRAAVLCRDIPQEAATQQIFEAIQGCGRQDMAEISRAVGWARGLKESGRRERLPRRNDQLIKETTQNGPDVEGLRSLSPVDPSSLSADQIIERLFPESGTLLCMGTTLEKAVTRPKSAFRGVMGQQQFVVPSRMTAISGTAKAGHRSPRCLENTGSRDYLVIEFDPPKWESLSDVEKNRFGGEDQYKQAKKNDCAALLWNIGSHSQRAPLVMVVDSANKSLHGWFNVAGRPESVMSRLFRYAVALGADPATWNRCQLVRMPQGTRANGSRQSVVYFNPQQAEAK